MRKIIVVTCLSFLITFMCHGQEKEKGATAELDVFGKFTLHENVELNALLFIQSPARHSKYSYTYLFSYEDKVTEVLIGMSREFFSNFRIGLSGGFELGGYTTFRAGASMVYRTEDFLAEALYEHGDGKDNYWYKCTVGYEPVPGLMLGVRAHKGVGIGGLIEGKVKKFVPYVMYGTEKIIIPNSLEKEYEQINHIVCGLRYEF
jgi:hypothetical protein